VETTECIEPKVSSGTIRPAVPTWGDSRGSPGRKQAGSGRGEQQGHDHREEDAPIKGTGPVQYRADQSSHSQAHCNPDAKTQHAGSQPID